MAEGYQEHSNVKFFKKDITLTVNDSYYYLANPSGYILMYVIVYDTAMHCTGVSNTTTGETAVIFFERSNNTPTKMTFMYINKD